MTKHWPLTLCCAGIMAVLATSLRAAPLLTAALGLGSDALLPSVHSMHCARRPSVVCSATRELEAVMRGGKHGRRQRRGGSGSGDESGGPMDGEGGLGGGGKGGSGGWGSSSWSSSPSPEDEWRHLNSGYANPRFHQGVLLRCTLFWQLLCAVSLLQAVSFLMGSLMWAQRPADAAGMS
jgi:hypothetical protein